MRDETKVVLEWRADPDAEFVLQVIAGVEFDIIEIALHQIDWRESANNCARIAAPHNDEKITDYHTGMVKGDVFPMIVIERSEHGYIILGGNQRASAMRRFDDSSMALLAYEVDPLTSSVRELIIRSLNSRHGWGSTKEERIEHAVYLVQEKGISTAIAARAMCVSDKSIQVQIRVNECRRDLVARGVKLESAPKGVIAEIARVNDRAKQTKLAKAVELFNPTIDMVHNLVSGIEKSKSEAATQKLISNCSKEWSDRQAVKPSKGKSVNKRREMLFSKLEALSLFLETGNSGGAFSTFDEAGCSVSKDGDRFFILAAKIQARLTCIKESVR